MRNRYNLKQVIVGRERRMRIFTSVDGWDYTKLGTYMSAVGLLLGSPNAGLGAPCPGQRLCVIVGNAQNL